MYGGVLIIWRPRDLHGIWHWVLSFLVCHESLAIQYLNFMTYTSHFLFKAPEIHFLLQVLNCAIIIRGGPIKPELLITQGKTCIIGQWENFPTLGLSLKTNHCLQLILLLRHQWKRILDYLWTNQSTIPNPTFFWNSQENTTPLYPLEKLPTVTTRNKTAT